MRLATSLTLDGAITAGTSATAVTDSAGKVNLAALKTGMGVAIRTANATLTASDTLAPFDCTSGVLTATLPLASTYAGASITVKKTDASANGLIVSGNGTDLIEGYNTVTLLYQNIAITLYRRSDGAGWHIG